MTDAAIDRKENDKLEREKQARETATYIKDKLEKKLKDKDSASCTVAIIGEWGTGKTSFINLVKDERKAKSILRKFINLVKRLWRKKPEDERILKGIDITEFSPWYFKDITNLTEEFLEVIKPESKCNQWSFNVFVTIFALSVIILYSSDKLSFLKPILSTDLSLLLKMTKQRAQLTALACTIVYFLRLVYKVTKYQDIELIISLITGKLSSSDLILKKQCHYGGKKVQEELVEILKNKPTLVIIDDIDRLNYEELRGVLSIVKGIGNLPNIVYLMAFDYNAVVRILKKEYDHEDDAAIYLEKFIQHKVYISATESEIEGFMYKLSSESEYSQYPELKDAVQSGRSTPEFFRCVNNFRNAKAIVTECNNHLKKMEKNRMSKSDIILAELVYIMTIKVICTDFYLKIKNVNTGAPLNAKEEETFKTLNDPIKEIITAICRIKTKTDDSPDSKSSLTRNGNDKINSIRHPDYCNRYFDASLDLNTITDEELASLNAQADDRDKLQNRINELYAKTDRTPDQSVSWLNTLSDVLVFELPSFHHRRDTLPDEEKNKYRNYWITISKVYQDNCDEIGIRDETRLQNNLRTILLDNYKEILKSDKLPVIGIVITSKGYISSESQVDFYQLSTPHVMQYLKDSENLWMFHMIIRFYLDLKESVTNADDLRNLQEGIKNKISDDRFFIALLFYSLNGRGNQPVYSEHLKDFVAFDKTKGFYETKERLKQLDNDIVDEVANEIGRQDTYKVRELFINLCNC